MERFLVERANLRSLFEARTKTRIVQGAGRCCRGANDYAVVMMHGQTLLDFCQAPEILATFPATIQAEIRVGLELSDGKTGAELLELINEVILQTENWKTLTHDIEGEAEISRQVVPATAAVLQEIAQNELTFSRQMWSGRYADAAQSAIAIRDHLAKHAELKPLQAWWEYQAACAYWAEGTASNNSQVLELAHRYVDQAGFTWPHGWLPRVRRHFTQTDPGQAGRDPATEFDASAAEKVLDWLRKQGTRSRKFDTTLSELDLLIRSDSHKDFERGIEVLGSMLGFSSRRYTETTAPDSIWWLGEVLLTFEAKNEASASTPISADTVRQANAQPRWASARLERAFETEFAIVVSPQELLADDARMVVDNERFMSVSELIELAEEASSCLRSIRGELPDLGDDMAISKVELRLAEEGLNASSVVEKLTSKSISELPGRTKEQAPG